MTTVGEISLEKLLATLKPILSPDVFVFMTLPHDANIPKSLPIQMLFREREGITIITTKSAAETEKLDYTFPCRMVILDVHSSLEAVGFMAVIAKELQEQGMGVNPVSGYYHDHCFVPEGREGEAMQCLEDLAERSRKAYAENTT